jgi:hypothetical protein
MDRVSYQTGPNGLVNLRVYFKNISNKELSNLTVKVQLPKELSVVASDYGQFEKGGKVVLVSVPVLEAEQEGVFIVNASVVKGAEQGSPFVSTAIANFTVPSVVSSGIPWKGEMKTTVTGQIDVPATDNSTEISNSTPGTGTKIWMPENLLELLITALVFVIFIGAVRYVIMAFKNTN